jgi:hypothetical protein
VAWSWISISWICMGIRTLVKMRPHACSVIDWTVFLSRCMAMSFLMSGFLSGSKRRTCPHYRLWLSFCDISVTVIEIASRFGGQKLNWVLGLVGKLGWGFRNHFFKSVSQSWSESGVGMINSRSAGGEARFERMQKTWPMVICEIFLFEIENCDWSNNFQNATWTGFGP